MHEHRLGCEAGVGVVSGESERAAVDAGRAVPRVRAAGEGLGADARLGESAGGAGDGGANGAAIDVHIIGRGVDNDSAGSFTGLNHNDRAIAQGHGHRGAGRIGQGRGVGDLAAFGDAAGSGQRQTGRIR